MHIEEEMSLCESRAKMYREEGNLELFGYYLGCADGLRRAKWLYKASEVSIDDNSA